MRLVLILTVWAVCGVVHPGPCGAGAARPANRALMQATSPEGEEGGLNARKQHYLHHHHHSAAQPSMAPESTGGANENSRNKE